MFFSIYPPLSFVLSLLSPTSSSSSASVLVKTPTPRTHTHTRIVFAPFTCMGVFWGFNNSTHTHIIKALAGAEKCCSKNFNARTSGKYQKTASRNHKSKYKTFLPTQAHSHSLCLAREGARGGRAEEREWEELPQ